MNKIFKEYAKPMLTLIVGGIILSFFGSFLPKDQYQVLIFIKACIAFYFGISLYKNKFSRAWLKKVIITIIFILVLYYDMGYKTLDILVYILNFIYFKGFIISLFYVYLGWLFFS